MQREEIREEIRESFNIIEEQEDEPPPDNRNMFIVIYDKLCIMVHSFAEDIGTTAFRNKNDLCFSMDRRTASFCRHR